MEPEAREKVNDQGKNWSEIFFHITHKYCKFSYAFKLSFLIFLMYPSDKSLRRERDSLGKRVKAGKRDK